jgi:hypothetical protein
MPATLGQPTITLASIAAARRRKGVIFVLSAFGDESSDETQKRVFAVGALFGNQEQWDNLSAKWVDRTGGIEFHANECESDQGEYKQFSHQENKKLYKDLTVLLAESMLLGYGVAIDLTEDPADILPESRYYRCFGEVVVYFAEQSYLSVPQEPVKFTFDRRLEIQYNATALYDYMAGLPEWSHRPWIDDEVGFATRRVVGIQVADLWTREVMKHLDNIVGPVKRKMRKSLEALDDTKRFTANFYGADYFQAVRKRIDELSVQDREGVFTWNAYKPWLDKNRIVDTLAHRVRYLAQYDAMQRASGGNTHFDDVRNGWAI